MIDSMSKWKTRYSEDIVVIDGKESINGETYYCVCYDDFSSEILTEASIRSHFKKVVQE